MNCCDYDCNQGRDCPARVARIGQRHLAAEPLPPSRNGYLKDLARSLLIVFVVMFAASIFVPFLR